MNTTFDQRKTVQLIAYFLKAMGGWVSYMKLIKLAYLADRESFKRRSDSITGDRYFSMKNGMVGSRLYDCFKGAGGKFWIGHIQGDGEYKVKLIGDPGRDDLAEDEILMADQILEKFSRFDRFRLGDITHQLGEYRKVEGGRKEVWEADILNAIVREIPCPPKKDREAYLEKLDPELF